MFGFRWIKIVMATPGCNDLALSLSVSLDSPKAGSDLSPNVGDLNWVGDSTDCFGQSLNKPRM